MLIKRFSLLELHQLLGGGALAGGEFDNFLRLVRVLDYMELQYAVYSRESERAPKKVDAQHSLFFGDYYKDIVERCGQWLAMERMFVGKRGIPHSAEQGSPSAPAEELDEARVNFLKGMEYLLLTEAKPFFEDRPSSMTGFLASFAMMETGLANQRTGIENFLDRERFRRVNQVVRLQPGGVFSIINTDGFFEEPFLQACAEGNIDLIKEKLHEISRIFFARRGAERDALYNTSERRVDNHEDRYYAIHLAVTFQQERALALLLKEENKYPVDQRTAIKGETALHIACRMGAVNLVRMLLAANADPNAKGFNDRTPLHEAAAGGHADVVLLLLEQKGIKALVKDKNGDTPLHNVITMPLPWDSEVGRFTAVVNQAIIAQEKIAKALVKKEPDLTKTDNAAKQSPLDLVFIHQVQTLQAELPGSSMNASVATLGDAMRNLTEQVACIEDAREQLVAQSTRRTKVLADNLSEPAEKLKVHLKGAPDLNIQRSEREATLFELRAKYVAPTFKVEALAVAARRQEVVPAELAAAVQAAKAAAAAVAEAKAATAKPSVAPGPAAAAVTATPPQ